VEAQAAGWEMPRRVVAGYIYWERETTDGAGVWPYQLALIFSDDIDV